jgi:RNA polymerase sigma factor for flagellar operon FliA
MNTRTHAPDGAPNTSPAGLPPGDGVRALWDRWTRDRTTADRERLILHYAPLVKYVAGRLSVGVTATVDLGDLISYGIFGLIDAIERFDPARGAPFEGYAIGRIKGAIIDELRAVDWVPRAVRDHARAVQTALSELEAELNRTPTDEELAAHMQISVARLRDLLDQVSTPTVAAPPWPRRCMIRARSTPRGASSAASCAPPWQVPSHGCRTGNAPSSSCTTSKA